MKTWGFLLLLLPASSTMVLGAPTPARSEGGKIVFAVALVGNNLCWTTGEKNMAIANASVFSATSPTTVQNLIPTTLELALSTGALSFNSFQEYVDARDDKQTLNDMLDDLPPSKQRALRSTVNILRSENNKR